MCLLMDNVLHNEFNYNNIVLSSHSHTRTKTRSQKYLYFNTIQYVHCSWLFFIYQKPMMVYKTLCELNKMYCIYIVHVIYYIIYNIVYTVSFSKAGFSQVAVNQVFLFFDHSGWVSTSTSTAFTTLKTFKTPAFVKYFQLDKLNAIDINKSNLNFA